MKIIEINAVPYGSTGCIAKEISNLASKKGESFFCYSWTKKRRRKVENNEILIGSFLGKCLHMLMSKITGFELNFSYIDTFLFIKKLKKINPDIIHLHIMHSWFINIPMLFRYINKNNIKVVWTFHDCWPLTGHCPYFDMVGCKKWKNECCNCPSYRMYPKSIWDNSKKMFRFKKKWFNYLDNLTIVTPSRWLFKNIKESYLKDKNIIVINNGINLNIFKPTNSSFRELYNCDDKIILLGVALEWDRRKGLDVFIKLSNDLNEKYQIVLVGTNSKIDACLPKNIISIHRTSNQYELAKIYSAADYFINPTREDNFPTVNIEALACGLPIITFDTGGSTEIIDNDCGTIIKKNDYKELIKCINRLNKKSLKSQKSCIERAKLFDEKEKFKEYLQLFDKLICK